MTKKVVEKEVLPEETVPDKPELCGHINRHSYGIGGKPDNLACTFPKGHAGDHGAMHKEAKYTTLREDPIHKRRPTGEKEEVFEVMTYWSDMAGIPPDQIPVPSEIKPPSLLEQEFGPEIAKQITL